MRTDRDAAAAAIERIERVEALISMSVGYRESNGRDWLGPFLESILDDCARLKRLHGIETTRVIPGVRP